MDRHSRDGPSGSTRFPRPRGDGPKAQAVSRDDEQVSPPTRGWTVVGGGSLRPRLGFPAHAGMDPRAAWSRSARRWFPRPRGDGPSNGVAAPNASMVSPPTRGWTVSFVHAMRSSVGFPAHAGMDRCDGWEADARTRFPRPRGDGPADRLGHQTGEGVSPPTRGWTRIERFAAHAHQGFPAHAGMDPVQGQRLARPFGFPRPRGDGPYAVRVVLNGRPCGATIRMRTGRQSG